MLQLPYLSEKLIKVLQEVGVVLLLLIALVLLLALFSFNPNDSGWSGASLQLVTNLMGISGSWLADFLFSLTGLTAWLFPLACVYLSLQLWQRPWADEDWNPFAPSLRLLGFVLLLTGLAAIASGHRIAVHLPYGAGGILGESVANLASSLMGRLGASLVFISGIFAGLSLITGWSWLVIMDEIGGFIIRHTENFTARIEKPNVSFNYLSRLKEYFLELFLLEDQADRPDTNKKEPHFSRNIFDELDDYYKKEK